MQALVYHGPDRKRAVGTVLETGNAVENVRQGDHVLASCISACGRCPYCRQGMYSQCQSGGGWILGHLVEAPRPSWPASPFADNSLHKAPEGLTDEQVLFLSDILATGFEVGVLNGNVRPGDVVAVVGAGPVGLAAMMTARLDGPSRMGGDRQGRLAPGEGALPVRRRRDRQQRRRRPGRGRDGPERGLGADVPSRRWASPRPSSSAPTWSARAAGSPTSASTATRPPSTWSGCGSATSPSPPAWSTPGPPPPCSGSSPRAAWTPGPFATHHLTHDQIIDAYGAFADAAKTNALKMVLTRP